MQGKPKLPGDDSRVLVVGGTGSGKSWAALDQLSRRSIDAFPWVAMDFKGHGVLREIPVTDIMDIDDPIPDRAGLYYMAAPFYHRDTYPTSDFFHRALARGNVGLFVDEGQGVGLWNAGFKACCFAGREAGVPMIICTQRPQGLDPHARSQASYVQLFPVDSEKDRREMQDTIPIEVYNTESLYKLPKYHSIWIDKAAKQAWTKKPCADVEDIKARIWERMAKPEGDEPIIPAEESQSQKFPARRVKI